MPAERRFQAMGSDGHVLVVAPDGSLAESLADQAERRIRLLERRWSRFEATSEVSRINAASPHPWPVSTDTLTLATRAVDAARETGGRFDATLLPALIRAGYDRTFAAIAATGPLTAASTALPHPIVASTTATAAGLVPSPGFPRLGRDDGWSGGDGPGGALLIDPAAGTVAVRAGHGLDPGGLGKGLAADLVTAELLASGATGALVSLGGDVRVRGRSPGADGWPLSVADPFDPGVELARFAIDDGAVATSSRMLRRWRASDGQERHHLLDPTTGAPSTTDVVAVTVVAGEAWWAEALTKALFSLDADRGLGHVHHALAVIITDDGRTLASPALQGVLR